MDQQPPLRMRKYLDAPIPSPDWPEGVTPMAFDAVDPRQCHAVLELAFPGQVAPFQDWYGNLIADPEYDAVLCVPAVSRDGTVVGFVQCWTTGFVKDLAVAPKHRRKGLGAALMLQAFAQFAQRGASHVDLKVRAGAMPARRLYERLGMLEMPL